MFKGILFGWKAASVETSDGSCTSTGDEKEKIVAVKTLNSKKPFVEVFRTFGFLVVTWALVIQTD